ncbi:hypothetical protein [Streptomyces sp. NK08204]|uniref:hypothetical protein n=1 Tax=Streptomyces sp. NK08204 TaxID=2873260 RepID=UPI001CED5F68|nr:hypothetical protein [Streptomyces sp. NK08204]
MLPTEPPLSLHRLVAPVPPARAREVVAAAHQGRTGPVPVSNAALAHSVYALVKTPSAATQDQLGNAAVTKAAAMASPAVPLIIMPSKTRSANAPSW